ncbi:MAG TPA: ORF6N domain-containing protein [Bacteroidia bacterium]|jgi:phage regulator Rha-like protein|nr:ORF6N domain-containing protein [Bacteroidia bacterium]
MTEHKPAIVPDEILLSKIYQLRGQRIMLDRDLADLYGVKAIRLREQVKRNQSRFPDNFMFQLTEAETELLVSQKAIPSKQHLGGTLPYAFTEHGVLMLANVLKSEEAIHMSVRIIELFVKMRELLLTHKDILLQLERMETQVLKNSEDIKTLFSALRKLLNPPEEPRKRIGYKVGKGE